MISSKNERIICTLPVYFTHSSISRKRVPAPPSENALFIIAHSFIHHSFSQPHTAFVMDVLERLGVSFASRASSSNASSSRALAVVDHLDAPGSWLTAILLADACDAYGGVVVACCETPASEIHALSRKLARGGARDAVTRGMARGT